MKKRKKRVSFICLCKECGREFEEGDIFCRKCGALRKESKNLVPVSREPYGVYGPPCETFFTCKKCGETFSNFSTSIEFSEFCPFCGNRMFVRDITKFEEFFKEVSSSQLALYKMKLMIEKGAKIKSRKYRLKNIKKRK